MQELSIRSLQTLVNVRIDLRLAGYLKILSTATFFAKISK